MKIGQNLNPIDIKPTNTTSKADSSNKPAATNFADIFQVQQKLFNGGGGHPEGPKDKKPT